MSKTKAQLEAENAAQRDIIAALGAEIAQLRELLAAISECADTVPVSDNDAHAEWKRSVKVLAAIHVAGNIEGWNGELEYSTARVREIAAEPLGYEVYRAFASDAPVSDEDATAILADAIANGTPVIAVDLAQWHA